MGAAAPPGVSALNSARNLYALFAGTVYSSCTTLGYQLLSPPTPMERWSRCTNTGSSQEVRKGRSTVRLALCSSAALCRLTLAAFGGVIDHVWCGRGATNGRVKA